MDTQQGNRQRSATIIADLRDPSRDTRIRAAQTAGKDRIYEAVPALIDALLADPDEWVRIDAAEALGKLNDPQAIPALITALKSEALIATYRAELEAVALLTDARQRYNKTIFLWGTLTAEISDLRVAAAQALGALGAQSAVPALQEAMHDQHDHHVRKAAAAALRTLEDKSRHRMACGDTE